MAIVSSSQTVITLQIREAAAKTKYPLFTFGAGVDERKCAFKFGFRKLMNHLQAELARLGAANAAAPATASKCEKTACG